MSGMMNIVLGFCVGSALGAVMLSSAIHSLKVKYEQTFQAALEAKRFQLLGEEGQRTSASELFQYLEATTQVAEAGKRRMLVGAVACVAIAGAIAGYWLLR